MSAVESRSELACVYAALILADDDVDVTADKINAILKAANIKFVEPYMPGLFAGALAGRNVKEMIACMAAPGAAAAPAADAAAPAAATADSGSKGKDAAPAKEAAKPESEESDDDMGFSLFD
uniref:Large ribosomal subunit protein P1 n=1 Tax=Schistocephalus solidus TaxID=70667 RepID=A0A0V0J6S4_SCHSO